MDAKSNIILSDSTERVYSADEGVQEVPLGLYLVKGDAMCVPCCMSRLLRLSDLAVDHRTLVGELDPTEDSKVPLSDIRADPIPSIRHQ